MGSLMDAPPLNIAYNNEIDTRGLSCPLPILRAKKALAEMAAGEVLKIVATDPGSVRDFRAFCKQTGNDLLGQETIGKDYIHFVKRR
jgi:tRNA 2-thiouridine synthesizing protein A